MHSFEEQPVAHASAGAGWLVLLFEDMRQLVEAPQELLRALPRAHLRAPHGEWLPLRQLHLGAALAQQVAPVGPLTLQLLHTLKAGPQLHLAGVPWELPLVSQGTCSPPHLMPPGEPLGDQLQASPVK